MMEKVQMYCVPGLGASPKIFENLDLPKDRIDIHFLEWKIPLSLEETIEHYAERCVEIFIIKILFYWVFHLVV